MVAYFLLNMNSGEKTVLRLGWVSFLNDVGSEVIARLVPFFVTGVLGASMSAVGAIEGIADATATLLKPIFGRFSDQLGRRKPFVVLGYSLSVFVRPFLAISGNWIFVAFLRFLERTGKGVRSAPRDALIADSSDHGKHGKSFGINRTLDTLGALLGIMLFGLWTWSGGQKGLTREGWIGLCLLSSIPGLAAIWILIKGVGEVSRSKSIAEGERDGKHFSPELKRYLLIMGFFGFANSSDAFILLRAKEFGYSLLEVLGLIVLLNLVSSLTAIPAAMASDRLGRRSLIALGWCIYAVSYALIGSSWIATNGVAFAGSVAVYGLFFGFTESVERAWIADLVPSPLRGRAYGAFGLVTGVVALPASLGFGWLWDHFGSQVPFFVASGVAFFSVILLILLVPSHRMDSRSSISRV